MSKSNFRAPEIMLPDFSDDDATTTTTVTKSRRVSFGTNFIKEFIVGSAVSAKCVSEYEMAFSSSDSSAINSSHSMVDSSKLNQHTFLVDENHKNQKPFPLNMAPPPPPLPLNQSSQENIAKLSKFSRTICFNSDSPTADMEFTGGCINLAKSILEKKNKEMTLIISSKTITPKEDSQSREETKFFDGSQLDMNTTHCFRTRREPAKILTERKFDGEKTKTFGDTDNEMSMTRCSHLFGMNKVSDASAIFVDADLSSDDSFKENKIPLNMIMQRLDNDGSDLENSLFNPEKSFSDFLNSGSFNMSTESEKLNGNESMDITREVEPIFSEMPMQMNRSGSDVEDSPLGTENLNKLIEKKLTEDELNSSVQTMECDSSIIESQSIEQTPKLTAGVGLQDCIMSARDSFSPNTTKFSESQEDIDKDMEMDSFISQEQLIAVEKTMAMEMTIYAEEPKDFDHEKSLEVSNSKEPEREVVIPSGKNDNLPNEELLSKSKETETLIFDQREMEHINLDGKYNLETTNDKTFQKDILAPSISNEILPNEEPLDESMETKSSALDQNEIQPVNLDGKCNAETASAISFEKDISVPFISKEIQPNEELLSKSKETETSLFDQKEIERINLDGKYNAEIANDKTFQKDISAPSISNEVLPNEKPLGESMEMKTSALDQNEIQPFNHDGKKTLEMPDSKELEREVAIPAVTKVDLPNEGRLEITKVVEASFVSENKIQQVDGNNENTLEKHKSEDTEQEKAVHSVTKEDQRSEEPLGNSEKIGASSFGQNEIQSTDFDQKKNSKMTDPCTNDIEQEVAIQSGRNENFLNEENQENTKEIITLEGNEMEPMDIDLKNTSVVPNAKNSEISVQSMTNEDSPIIENIENTNEKETSTPGPNEVHQKNGVNVITFEENRPSKRIKPNSVQEKQEEKEKFFERKEPPLVDQKVLQNLKSQSTEPDSLWSIDDVKYSGMDAEWSFKFNVLESHVIIHMQLKVLEDDYSQVKGIEVRQVEEAKLRMVEYMPTFEFGVKQLVKQVEQEKKIIKSMLNVSYFMDQMNSFGAKLNRYLEQIYSILTLYPGSRLSDSVLSFRLFSFPLLFSTTVFIDLFDLYQLSKSSLSFKNDFGTLNEYKITDIFENCLSEECPLREFVIRSTGHIIEMERKTGRISKRSHIGLLPRHFHSK